MKKPLIMTPGPTYVNEEVRRAMSVELTNPDIDNEFYEFYKKTCNKIKTIINTKNDVLILCGEGILGLEAACASLTEKGDRVLCIDNGIFGKGFADFIEMYEGEAVYFKSDYDRGININDLKDFLERDNNFKYATIVHCETPSGITNNIEEICPLIKSYGIMTVVDSVSAIGGEKVLTDEWGIDIILGASQKCLSAPVGLTFLSISDLAWNTIHNRKTKIKSYYCNLELFKDWYEKKWFPYTMPNHLIYALDKAIDILSENDFIKRHKIISEAVRYSIINSGLSLYPKDSFSNTLTAVNVPDEITFEKIYNQMLRDYNIMSGSSFGYLKDKIIRIGHMGENCKIESVYYFLYALNNVLYKNGIKMKSPIYKLFSEAL